MRVLLAMLSALTVCAVLTACATHRKDLESTGPPQGLPATSTGEIATAAMSLLESESNRTDLLSTDALAPLTSAAAIVFKRTGSTQAFALTEQYASALLRAQVTRGRASGFFGAASGSAPQAQATAVSGLALAEAYAVTGDHRYRDATLAAAVDVTNPVLGWVSSPSATGVRDGSGDPGPNIAMTANAALLLKRAGALGHPALFTKSRAALRTIYSSQAAVGRWYAHIGGHLPMSLGEWATTLFDLLSDGSKESLGIVGGGIPALYENAFGGSGQLKNSQTEALPTGVALTLRALAAYPVVSLADNAFIKLLEQRRRNGTIGLAKSDDTVSQAYFALALAQRIAGAGQSSHSLSR